MLWVAHPTSLESFRLAGPVDLAVVTTEKVLEMSAELFRDSGSVRNAGALLTLALIRRVTLVNRREY